MTKTTHKRRANAPKTVPVVEVLDNSPDTPYQVPLLTPISHFGIIPGFPCPVTHDQIFVRKIADREVQVSHPHIVFQVATPIKHTYRD